jgi:hypothetical protein
MTITRRTWTLAAAAAATLMLGGCAALNTLHSEVSSFGDWPTGRAPGSYSFERLPSQQARAEVQDQLEAAARPALAAAGFKPAAAGQAPDVIVQLGARITRTEGSPWDDPLWWRGSFGYYRYGPWVGPRWSLSARLDGRHFEREVAVLIRDRASGQPLYEARASTDGATAGGIDVLRAMYAAALKDFPAKGPNPRNVATPMDTEAAAPAAASAPR